MTPRDGQWPRSGRQEASQPRAGPRTKAQHDLPVDEVRASTSSRSRRGDPDHDAILVGSGLAVTGLLRARAAEREATAQAAKAVAINEFLQNVLGSAHPVHGQGRDVTILEALAHAVDTVDEAFAEQPDLQGAVLDTVGRTYVRLGRYQEAESVLTKPVSL